MDTADYPFWSLHSTAFYTADEFEIHIMALNDFRSTVAMDELSSSGWDRSHPSPSDAAAPYSPSSPSLVAFTSSCYPLSPFKSEPIEHHLVVVPEILRITGDEDNIVIKMEPKHDVDYVSMPIPNYHRSLCVPHSSGCGYTTDDERERLRRRQRIYEKRYRSRKRADLKKQRDAWLGLEIELADTRKKHCQPVARAKLSVNASLKTKLRHLLEEERALKQDRIAMRSLCAWERISRIREYTDKDELHTVSEWQHNAEKVIGQCGMIGPRRFNPYAPMELHFTW
ncbi:hypothetical protein BBJ29_002979 [Phytophthora kernoviae]|uniref:BZIP domain-containing protein n=1 Tax=Phytophthora kernoviae TaxID=325452 RepID=A0A3F2RPF1_9STRA|nr:hypothetical protein BBJ29_002979 [Phytophthora kernoviae]RLN61670.1 hypothetical protein BBP00_00005252 [Phytophthora kernoviae]